MMCQKYSLKTCNERFSGKSYIKFLLGFALFLTSSGIFAQNLTVSGKVIDENGESLPGLTVLVKGTSTGTVTDFEGAYQLEVSASDILVFSFVGYATKEITVGSKSVIDIQMELDITALDEIVVIGYGEVKKSVSTGSISSINSKDLGSFTVPRVDQNMQALASSVIVSNSSGSPGSGTSMFLRGVGTNRDARPLLVIDGLIVEDGTFSLIDPSEIESMEVLKDAASVGIYGARGANGVIMVTTKKGKNGKVSLTAESNYGVQRAWRVPELANREQYLELNRRKLAESDYQDLITYADQTGAETDWMSEIFDDATIQNHKVSITAGNEKSQVFSSISYLDQEGIIDPSKSNFKRIAFRLNTNNKVNDFLRIGENIAIITSRRNSIPENNIFSNPVMDALNLDPVTPVFDSNNNGVGQFGFGRSSQVQNDYMNPLARLHISNNTTDILNIYGTAYAEISFLKDFKLRSDFGIDMTANENRQFSPEYYLTDNAQNEVNDVAQNYYRRLSLNSETYVTYSKSFGLHSVSAVAGGSFRRTRDYFLLGTGSGIPSNKETDKKFWTLNQTDQASRTSSSGFANQEYKFGGFFGRVIYDFNQKYLFTLVARRDASSRFGVDNRFGFFPAVSGGWVISNEDFWNFKPINYLKIRTSWGRNGNDRIGDLSFAATVDNAFDKGYTFGTGSDRNLILGVAANSLVNFDVEWESGEVLDFGVEGKAFQGMLIFEATYYKKTTKGLLITKQEPFTVGTRGTFENLGTVENSGIELKIDISKSFGDVNVSSVFNFATLNNEVTEMQNPDIPEPGFAFPLRNQVITEMKVGEPLYYFRGLKTLGVFQSDEDAIRYVHTGDGPNRGQRIQPNAGAGDLKYFDANGDGVIDDNDYVNIGKPWYDFTLGWTLNANYKGFYTSAIFLATVGQDIYRVFERNIGKNNYFKTWYDESWDAESNPNGTYPSLASSTDNLQPSDLYVEDGDFIRLKNLQVGYNLPVSFLEPLKLQAARVYLSFDNLLTWTKYSGFDPEIGNTSAGLSTFGIDQGYYPQARTYGGGLSLTF
ncbi:MAG: TonB-dependent receptor [bacterium]|nr:TonB-dependent receptor [bacterium]